jgi:hypothetical protein
VSNCLIWAFRRFFIRGGYVIFRKSHYGWWPHFLWSPDLKTFYDYQPKAPNHHLLIPPPLYRGVVRKTSPCGITSSNEGLPLPSWERTSVVTATHEQHANILLE